MKLIKKIRIQRFRSLGNAVIPVEEFNIYSGANNMGKSNILKALNLFFNYDTSSPYDFDKDYNKAYTESATGARSVTITIWFHKQGGAGMLAHDFSIQREFPLGAKTPITTYYSEDKELQEKIEQKNNGVFIGQFYKFLNKVHYYYVPAVRDREFTRRFLTNFESVIRQNANDANFEGKVADLSEILKKQSVNLSKDFEKFLQIPTSASLSSKIEDILGAIEINVESGIRVQSKAPKKVMLKKYVNIFSTGDGVLMSYLVYFLNYLCKDNPNQKFIWGYEEPENSLEYSKAQSLADKFYAEFMHNAQIFITTHSPAFIKLKDEKNVLLHRVYMRQKESDEGKADNRESVITTLSALEKRLSLFPDTESADYKLLERELHMIEMAKEIEVAVDKLNQERELVKQQKKEIERKLQEKNKPIIFVEDNYTQLYKVAWLKLNGTNVDTSTIDSIFDANAKFYIYPKGGCGNLRGYLNNPNMEDMRDKKIIGIFDFDEAYEDYSKLKDLWELKEGYKKRKKFDVYAMLLPIPDFRKNIASIDYGKYSKLEVELLFTDDTIKKVYGKHAYKTEKIIGDIEIPKIQNKADFWKKVIILQKPDFSEFQRLFDKIDEILNLCSTTT
ncbi:MAG: ATP-binding protein [Planctomycetota bacterium]|jgi:AAA15 family ATPase/GTPase|nr:ATP-binding protein [Planctomycetota bacterium]